MQPYNQYGEPRAGETYKFPVYGISEGRVCKWLRMSSCKLHTVYIYIYIYNFWMTAWWANMADIACRNFVMYNLWFVSCDRFYCEYIYLSVPDLLLFWNIHVYIYLYIYLIEENHNAEFNSIYLFFICVCVFFIHFISPYTKFK